MIPKILHYGAFGGWKFSDLNRRCMESWDSVLPEFSKVQWGDENGPNRNFFKRAVKESPINAHNYIGIWALYRFGGIMVDNDVEIVRPFDLNHGVFVGFQRRDSAPLCINNAVIGAVPRHPFIKRILRKMEKGVPTGDPLWFGPGILTEELRNLGMSGFNVEQKIDDVMIYDSERFYPFWHGEPIDKSRLTDRTFAIHHWEGSWSKKPI